MPSDIGKATSQLVLIVLLPFKVVTEMPIQHGGIKFADGLAKSLRHVARLIWDLHCGMIMLCCLHELTEKVALLYRLLILQSRNVVEVVMAKDLIR